MSDIEKRLRDALGAAAETVDESRPRRPLPPRKPRRFRFPAWFLPLCAAASVITIVAAFAGLRLIDREPKPLDATDAAVFRRKRAVRG